MPLLGGDSNSFWRFDLKLVLKGFIIILIIRAISIPLDIYPKHIPVLDDCIQAMLDFVRWLAITFDRITAKYFSF